jgi:hypothetical protein
MAGHRHAYAWSLAVEKGEPHAYSAPPLLPSDGRALSCVPGERKELRKRYGIILRRARLMQRAQESPAHTARIYTKEVMLWMRFFRS